MLPIDRGAEASPRGDSKARRGGGGEQSDAMFATIDQVPGAKPV